MLFVASVFYLGCGSSTDLGDGDVGRVLPDASSEAGPDNSPSDDDWRRYQPTSVGSTWTSAITVAGGGTPAIETATLLESSPTGLTVKTVGNDGRWRVDIYQVSTQGLLESATKSYLADGTLSTELTFAPPDMILPSRLAVGVSASTTSTQTSSMSLSGIVTRDLTVTGPEEVTVSAGTFTAMKVSSVITATHRDATPWYTLHNTRWWAVGVGNVKTVNVVESNSSSPTTFELTAYTIK